MKIILQFNQILLILRFVFQLNLPHVQSQV